MTLYRGTGGVKGEKRKCAERVMWCRKEKKVRPDLIEQGLRSPCDEKSYTDIDRCICIQVEMRSTIATRVDCCNIEFVLYCTIEFCHWSFANFKHGLAVTE
jgi:hypothetical protein